MYSPRLITVPKDAVLRITVIVAALLGLAGCAAAQTSSSAEVHTIAGGAAARQVVDSSAERLIERCVSSAVNANANGIHKRELRRVQDALVLRSERQTFLFYTTVDYLVECRGEPPHFVELGYARTTNDVGLARVGVEGLRGGQWLSSVRIGSATGRVAFVINGQEVEPIREHSIAAQITGKPDAIRLYDREGQLHCEVRFPLSAGSPTQRREQFENCSSES